MELVLHLAALRRSRRNRRIRNEAQVVAEHRAANYSRYTERNAETRHLRHLDRNRRDHRDRAHRSPHRRRDERRHHEQHHHRELRRDKVQQQVSRRRGARTPENPRENARAEEDENHQENVAVAEGACHDVHLLVEIQLAVLQARDENRHQERRHDGDVVEPHRNLEDIFERDAETQIEDQEHGDRQEGNRVALDFIFKIFVLHVGKDRKRRSSFIQDFPMSILSSADSAD